MKRIVIAMALVACKGSSGGGSASGGGTAAGSAGSGAEAGSGGGAARPTPPLVPTGTIAGTAFAPNAVLLLESSDGGKLGLYQLAADRLERKRCAEPMSSDREITAYRKISEWTVGTPVEIPTSGWGTSGLEGATSHDGVVRVTLTEKNPTTFRVAGKIEAVTADGSWKLSGPFEGEYCPTKVVARGDGAALGGVVWTQAAIDPATIPTTPVAAVVAGTPAPIAHATWREVARSEGGKEVRRQELVLFTTVPGDPCGGDDDRIDHFKVISVPAPAAGAALAGLVTRDASQVDAISAVALGVTEPDGVRAWYYDQYFTAALAIDRVDDKQVTGRVLAALPDTGKSMVAGAFTAVRCPPAP